jgi:hypothetical protein
VKSLIIVAVLALAAATTAGAARDTFSGNVCSLLTSTQVTSFHVASAGCTSHRSATNAYGTAYSGAWGSPLNPEMSSLTFIVGRPTSPSYLALARSTTKWGAPVKVGDWARGELVNGGTGVSIAFTMHGYYVVMRAHLPKTPLKSLAPAITVAKLAAANL